jgi:hypothetical protein
MRGFVTGRRSAVNRVVQTTHTCIGISHKEIHAGMEVLASVLAQAWEALNAHLKAVFLRTN